MYGLAFLYGAVQMRLDKAAQLCADGWKVSRKVLGEGHRLTCQFMVIEAWFEAWAGQFDDAQRHAEAAWKVNKEALGEEHPETLDAMCTLGMVHALRYNLKEAEDLLLPGIERMRKVLGDRCANTLFYSRTLAMVYMCQGHYQEAQEIIQRIIEDGGRLLGDDHLLVATARVHMMALYAMQGQGTELEEWCLQQTRRLQRKPVHNVLAEANVWTYLAWLQATYPSAVIRNGEKAVKNAQKACQLTGWGSAGCQDSLAAAYAEVQDFDAAVAQEEKAMDTPTYPGDIVAPPEYLQYHLGRYKAKHATREGFLTSQARWRIAEGRYEAAEHELTTASKTTRDCLGKTHPETLGCILALIELYDAWEKPEEAAKWRDQLPPRGSPPQW